MSVNGVSPKTHFAQVLVEADYRMKLIGIGLEKPPVRLVSYVDRANPAQVSRNALQRWYFVPDYQCVRVSDDRLAMELVGDGVKLVGEGRTGHGRRAAASRGQKSNKASQDFVTSFTKKYPELADRSPVYAELRNLIDLSVAAAYIQKQDFYGKAGWKMPLLGNEKDFAVETYNSPKQVAAAVNAIWKGHTPDDAHRRRREHQRHRRARTATTNSPTTRARSPSSAAKSSSIWPRASGGGTEPAARDDTSAFLTIVGRSLTPSRRRFRWGGSCTATPRNRRE